MLPRKILAGHPTPENSSENVQHLEEALVG
jgi:hypothetical protein